ncbi:hypothetical protein BZA70DRAFT_157751 [Myxozyma melibiosi]|uniref:DNA polymerase n=1 Tax=Myxozyma melibiosi TaxID=54550 RepID=A0ABR1F6G3_9ASCO
MELRRCGLTAQVLRAGAAPLVVKIDWVRRCIASGRIEDRSRYILNIQSASMSSLSATPPVTPVKRRRRKHTDEDDSSSLSDPASPTPSTKVPKTRKKRVAKDLSAVAAASREDSDLPELDPIYLQKLSCYRPHPLICPNEDLAKILAQIRHLRDLDGNDTSVRAYSSAIASIRSYPYKIKSGKEVKRLNGCGAKTLKLVNEFLETGAIESETAKADTAEYEAIERLQEIWGVGGRTASSWVREKGWKSIEDVQREGMSSLTRHQEAGVRYYQDLKVKLNREQVAAIAETVTRYAKDIHPDALSLVGGSYRRGNTSHADVDMLLTVPNNKPGEHYTFLQELIKRLQKANLITEVLTITSNLRKGELLDLALVVWSTVPNVSGVPLAHFRVDLICADWKVIGPAVVGWTGGTTFERDLRIRAKKLGYKFHSSGLLDLKTNKLVDCTADTMEAAERKVFEILQLPYYDPELRNTG